MVNILIIAEQSGGRLKKYSCELASKAQDLLGESGGAVSAFSVGCDDSGLLGGLGRYGISKVISASHDELRNYSGEAYAKVLCDVIADEEPDVVLATASAAGEDMMARAAMRLKVGLASDCVAIEQDGGRIRCRRPVFAGNALIDLTVDGAPQMATLRPNVFSVRESGGAKPVVDRISVEPGGIRARVVDVVEAEVGMVDLAEAKRIVAAGRGIGSAQNFRIIYELAEAIGAGVGASRSAVDAGFISHDHQVGQTGKMVNPTLYIACGISGAIQHFAGMRTSRVIVAVNSDPEAPIFSKADYGIVGDLFQVVPALTRTFKRLLAD